MSEESRKEKIRQQRYCYAIKACHMMQKSVEDTAKCLAMEESVVRVVFGYIERGWIDFDSPFSE